MEDTKRPRNTYLLDPAYKSSLILRSVDLTTPKIMYYEHDLEGQDAASEIEKNLLSNGMAKGSRKRRNCSLCCCYSFYIILIVLLVLGIVFLKLIPKNPAISLGDLQLTEFAYNASSSGSSTGPQIVTAFTCELNVTNRNHHVDAIYSPIDLRFFYANETLGNLTQPKFEQKKKTTTPLELELSLTRTRIQSQANADSLETAVAARNVRVQLTGKVKGTHKVLGLKVKRFEIDVECMFNVRPSSGNSEPTELSHSCYYET